MYIIFPPEYWGLVGEIVSLIKQVALYNQEFTSFANLPLNILPQMRHTRTDEIFQRQALALQVNKVHKV